MTHVWINYAREKGCGEVQSLMPVVKVALYDNVNVYAVDILILPFLFDGCYFSDWL